MLWLWWPSADLRSFSLSVVLTRASWSFLRVSWSPRRASISLFLSLLAASSPWSSSWSSSSSSSSSSWWASPAACPSAWCWSCCLHRRWRQGWPPLCLSYLQQGNMTPTFIVQTLYFEVKKFRIRWIEYAIHIELRAFTFRIRFANFSVQWNMV